MVIVKPIFFVALNIHDFANKSILRPFIFAIKCFQENEFRDD